MYKFKAFCSQPGGKSPDGMPLTVEEKLDGPLNAWLSAFPNIEIVHSGISSNQAREGGYLTHFYILYRELAAPKPVNPH